MFFFKGHFTGYLHRDGVLSPPQFHLKLFPSDSQDALSVAPNAPNLFFHLIYRSKICSLHIKTLNLPIELTRSLRFFFKFNIDLNTLAKFMQ